MFPKGCNRGDIFHISRDTVPEGWGIMTEGVRKIICKLHGQKRVHEGT